MSETNKINKEEVKQEPKKKKASFYAVFDGFDTEWLNRNLGFILLIAVLAWIHIGNNHKAVTYIRSISKMEKEIRELRWEYMTEKSQLMHDSKQSEVASKVEHLGLKELTNPPHIIEMEK